LYREELDGCQCEKDVRGIRVYFLNIGTAVKSGIK
jgi:hypothetical protein